MTTFTHEIIRMERGETKGSKSPLWRCRTKDGQSVNVFQHSDPARDNTALFREAGYFDLMNALKVGEAIEWTQSSIWVVMEKENDWWAVKDVARRATDAEPDVLWQPDLKAYRERAIRQAKMIFENDFRSVDTELTGLRTDDEITAVAVMTESGEILFNELICPPTPGKLWRVQKDGLSAADITGITPEQLMEAPHFKAVYQDICNALDGEIWVAYNASFDMAALDRECSNARLPLLTPIAVHDAATIAAEYLGNWNEKRQWFEMMKLADVAAQLGVMMPVTHEAGADARATLAVLKAIADDAAGAPF